jgi:hypothetical protein
VQKNCREYAKQYRGNEKVKYYRFDPDAVGRHAMDDAGALDDIQNEIAEWCNAAVNDQLETLANTLKAAMTETSKVATNTLESDSNVSNSCINMTDVTSDTTSEALAARLANLLRGDSKAQT